jgi:hypothetical protein
MLLAVGFTFRLIRARFEHALIHGRGSRVLVVVVTVHFLLSRPSIGVILASRDRALPRARVSLFVLGKIARTLELLVAAGLAALLGS